MMIKLQLYENSEPDRTASNPRMFVIYSLHNKISICPLYYQGCNNRLTCCGKMTLTDNAYHYSILKQRSSPELLKVIFLSFWETQLNSWFCHHRYL